MVSCDSELEPFDLLLTALSVPGAGLKAVVDAIDVRDDFKNYMQQYGINWQMSGQRGPRREGPPEDGFVRSDQTRVDHRIAADIFPLFSFPPLDHLSHPAHRR